MVLQPLKKPIEINCYNPKTGGMLFDEVMDKLKNNVPNGATLLLQTCANNPTGIDPTENQWVEISRLCKDKGFFPLMDSAYIGFVTGDILNDSFPLRTFMEDKHTFAYCQSFSKNMGMYGERIGVLHFVCPDKQQAKEHTKYFR